LHAGVKCNPSKSCADKAIGPQDTDDQTYFITSKSIKPQSCLLATETNPLPPRHRLSSLLPSTDAACISEFFSLCHKHPNFRNTNSTSVAKDFDSKKSAALSLHALSASSHSVGILGQSGTRAHDDHSAKLCSHLLYTHTSPVYVKRGQPQKNYKNGSTASATSHVPLLSSRISHGRTKGCNQFPQSAVSTKAAGALGHMSTHLVSLAASSEGCWDVNPEQCRTCSMASTDNSKDWADCCAQAAPSTEAAAVAEFFSDHLVPLAATEDSQSFSPNDCLTHSTCFTDHNTGSRGYSSNCSSAQSMAVMDEGACSRGCSPIPSTLNLITSAHDAHKRSYRYQNSVSSSQEPNCEDGSCSNDLHSSSGVVTVSNACQALGSNPRAFQSSCWQRENGWIQSGFRPGVSTIGGTTSRNQSQKMPQAFPAASADQCTVSCDGMPAFCQSPPQSCTFASVHSPPSDSFVSARSSVLSAPTSRSWASSCASLNSSAFSNRSPKRLSQPTTALVQVRSCVDSEDHTSLVRHDQLKGRPSSTRHAWPPSNVSSAVHEEPASKASDSAIDRAIDTLLENAMPEYSASDSAVAINTGDVGLAKSSGTGPFDVHQVHPKQCRAATPVCKKCSKRSILYVPAFDRMQSNKVAQVKCLTSMLKGNAAFEGSFQHPKKQYGISIGTSLAHRAVHEAVEEAMSGYSGCSEASMKRYMRNHTCSSTSSSLVPTFPWQHTQTLQSEEDSMLHCPHAPGPSHGQRQAASYLSFASPMRTLPRKQVLLRDLRRSHSSPHMSHHSLSISHALICFDTLGDSNISTSKDALAAFQATLSSRVILSNARPRSAESLIHTCLHSERQHSLASSHSATSRAQLNSGGVDGTLDCRAIHVASVMQCSGLSGGALQCSPHVQAKVSAPFSFTSQDAHQSTSQSHLALCKWTPAHCVHSLESIVSSRLEQAYRSDISHQPRSTPLVPVVCNKTHIAASWESSMPSRSVARANWCAVEPLAGKPPFPVCAIGTTEKMPAPEAAEGWLACAASPTGSVLPNCCHGQPKAPTDPTKASKPKCIELEPAMNRDGECIMADGACCVAECFLAAKQAAEQHAMEVDDGWGHRHVGCECDQQTLCYLEGVTGLQQGNVEAEASDIPNLHTLLSCPDGQRAIRDDVVLRGNMPSSSTLTKKKHCALDEVLLHSNYQQDCEEEFPNTKDSCVDALKLVASNGAMERCSSTCMCEGSGLSEQLQAAQHIPHGLQVVKQGAYFRKGAGLGSAQGLRRSLGSPLSLCPNESFSAFPYGCALQPKYPYASTSCSTSLVCHFDRHGQPPLPRIAAKFHHSVRLPALHNVDVCNDNKYGNAIFSHSGCGGECMERTCSSNTAFAPLAGQSDCQEAQLKRSLSPEHTLSPCTLYTTDKARVLTENQSYLILPVPCRHSGVAQLAATCCAGTACVVVALSKIDTFASYLAIPWDVLMVGVQCRLSLWLIVDRLDVVCKCTSDIVAGLVWIDASCIN
jgi:hypothetical protein